jgi:hypothetical protein
VGNDGRATVVLQGVAPLFVQSLLIFFVGRVEQLGQFQEMLRSVPKIQDQHHIAWESSCG